MEFRVLLCDDDEAYSKSLKPLAAFCKFSIQHFVTWEEAQAELEQGLDRYDAIILDALGQRNSDSHKNDIGALTQAVMWLKKNEGRGNYIPYIINSAFVETSVKTGFEEIPHFDKTQKQEKEMFNSLKELIESKESYKIKKRHTFIFEVFDNKYLPDDMAPKMVDVINNMSSVSVKKVWFNSLRDILEGIFKRANSIDNALFLPDVLLNPVQNGRPNLKACTLYWNGKLVDLTKIGGTGTLVLPQSILSQHASWLLSSLVENVNIFSHNYTEQFSIYAYRSTVNSLLELILWFKSHVDKNYPRI